jgi:hypothetical protein
MFKVGDIITGIPGSSKEYTFTNDQVNMEVIKVNRSSIVVKILDIPTYLFDIFTVDPKFFILVEHASNKTAIERKIAFMYKRFEEG